MPALIFKEGPLAGQRFEISQQIVVGRHEADITIEDSEVSRRHATIRPVGDAIEIEDLGSLNGTWVNGIRLETPHRLSSGDTLKLGQSLIEVELEAAPSDLTVLHGVESDQTVVHGPRADRARPEQPTSLPTDTSPAPPSRGARQRIDREGGPSQPPPSPRPPAPSGPEPARAPAQAFGTLAPPPPRRRRSASTRVLTPIILSIAVIVATAAALIIYFVVQR